MSNDALYGGAASFLRVPHCIDPAASVADVIVRGIPFDLATTGVPVPARGLGQCVRHRRTWCGKSGAGRGDSGPGIPVRASAAPAGRRVKACTQPARAEPGSQSDAMQTNSLML